MLQRKGRQEPRTRRPADPQYSLGRALRRHQITISPKTVVVGTSRRLAAKVAKPVPEFVKKTQSGLPNMMESMKIVSGVTIKEGDLVKTGPKADGAAGMTRSAYFMKKQLESTMDQDAGAGLSSNTNTWGEGGNTFNGQEVGILQMIQFRRRPNPVGEEGQHECRGCLWRRGEELHGSPAG